MWMRTLRLPFLVAVPLVVLFRITMVAQDALSVPSNVVPQGTVFLIQLSDKLDTTTVKAGDHFHARLAESLVTANGQTIEQPLGAYRGMAVAGCDPGEMGIGPVFAVPKLLRQHGLSIDDIGIWELNEA